MTTFDHIIRTIRQLKPELATRFYVNSIGLFGSVVRNDFSPESSDIDVIVDFKQPIGIEFVDLAEYLESKINRKVDLVSRNGIKTKYLEAIEAEIIYV
jgi:predicted nucleotidyltransferase